MKFLRTSYKILTQLLSSYFFFQIFCYLLSSEKLVRLSWTSFKLFLGFCGTSDKRSTNFLQTSKIIIFIMHSMNDNSQWKAAFSTSFIGGSFTEYPYSLNHSFDEWASLYLVRWKALPTPTPMGIQWKAVSMKSCFDEKLFRWKAALMKSRFEEKPLWWKAALMKSCFDEKLLWWKAALMKSRFDEKLLRWKATPPYKHLKDYLQASFTLISSSKLLFNFLQISYALISSYNELLDFFLVHKITFSQKVASSSLANTNFHKNVLRTSL